ncbi:GNAT family N-acetyltransferase [Rhodococcus jostii]|uniref:GNAT family N-acetyltransferase n=1 Tax=Rhodococcus jostii TaxID=132919 RepID=UPI000934960A|nr:GNAT family N-acetyltransferase [Rhodococcus jostii]
MPSTEVTPAADVMVRHLAARDWDAVQQLHQRLNEHDTYLRFFVVRAAHLDELAATLCLQNPDHCALGAFIDGALVGVANYISLDDVTGTTPTTVEFALVVDHDHQGSQMHPDVDLQPDGDGGRIPSGTLLLTGRP